MYYPNIGPDQQRVLTYVPKCLWKRLKVIAAMKNTSLRQILIGLIQEYVAAQIEEVKMLVADHPTYSVAKSVKGKNGKIHRVKTAKLDLQSRLPTSKMDKKPDEVLSNKGGLSGPLQKRF